MINVNFCLLLISLLAIKINSSCDQLDVNSLANTEGDTIYIHKGSFKYLADEKKIEFGNYRKKNKNHYYYQTFKTKDSSSHYLVREIVNGSYIIFLDKKNRKIEEGKWSGEMFYGSYKSYYKNGKIKCYGEIINGTQKNLKCF